MSIELITYAPILCTCVCSLACYLLICY